MEMGEFLNEVSQKLGPEVASNMAKAANDLALIEILVSKGICTKEEYAEELSKQLDRLFEVASDTYARGKVK